MGHGHLSCMFPVYNLSPTMSLKMVYEIGPHCRGMSINLFHYFLHHDVNSYMFIFRMSTYLVISFAYFVYSRALGKNPLSFMIIRAQLKHSCMRCHL